MILLHTNCEGFWAWPWPLILAFLLGMLLGWLLSKIFGSKDESSCQNCGTLQADLDACRKNTSNLQADLDACRKNVSNLKASATAAAATAAAAASFAVAKVDDSVKDDLTKVEGIGPKIKELLNEDGIWSFKQLADSSIDRLQGILDKAGARFRIHNPKTWAQQSDLAAKGKWDELKKWQDELDGGL